MQLVSKLQTCKAIAPTLAVLDSKTKERVFDEIISQLTTKAEAIFSANIEDYKKATEEKLPTPLLKRLTFDREKLNEMVKAIKAIKESPELVGRCLSAKELDHNLNLYKVACPIGVIAMIFESRPDALIQISALALKSGNAIILKGGREAAGTNRILAQIIHDSAIKHGLPKGWLLNIESRDDVTTLLKEHTLIDLVIPRGSNEFVQYIMASSKIPVMGHADGVCHLFVDKDADLEMAVSLIIDSKTQYVAACNTVETLLIHKDIAEKFLPIITQKLEEKKVTIHYPQNEKWSVEYLDYAISIKICDDLHDAINHINRYGSHHTDGIVSKNSEAIESFMNLVDSADVFANASTRFADGYRFGLGAEVGISTGKLHARGPVGIEGLLTYKWKLYGSGQIVADYVGPNAKNFTHKEISL